MKRTACGVSVLLVVSCFGLVSCMGRGVNAGPAEPDLSSTAAVGDTVAPETSWLEGSADYAATGTDTFSESSVVLLPPTYGGLGLELAAAPGADQILIRGDIEPDGFSVTRLDAPARVVVDLHGEAGTSANLSNRSFDGLGAATFDRLRIGSHPDKTRMVLDLNGDLSTVSYDARQTTEGLLLTLRRAGTVTAAETSTDGWESATTDVVPTEKAATVTETAVARTPESISPKLTALRFGELADGTGALHVDMQSAGVFSLKRTAPSEYVLVLEDASVEPGTVSTVLAPPGTSLIRSARPVVEGRDVLVRIFTKPEATLSARPRAGGVVVTAASPLADIYAADPRAQLADDAAAGDAAANGTAADTTAAAGDVEIGDDDADIAALLDESPRYTGRLISLDLQDTDIDNALRIIAEVSNLNIIASEDVAGKVTLRLIDVPWDQALDVILKTNGLDKVQEGNVVRVAPVEKLRAEREALKQAQQAEEDLEPLAVKYLRISYARAAELKPLVETVLSERGTVTYDERTNQLIIKDIRKGLRNAVELVSKLDLRTPQVLLETQIVEATRSFTRNLGSELGFTFVQSPETGNATGYNFPNSVGIGGSATGSSLPGAASAYPADATSSALSILLGSADGTKSLSARLSGAEAEGIARIISRPAIATTNNKQAEIKSVRKIRVRTPSGGTSVAVGGSSSGGSAVATEVIEVGIVLEVTPQASPDYYVLLDVDAKSSSIDEGRSTDGIPEEIERSTTSTILVSSGQTFVMGGIYKIDERDTNLGTPWLKDVPVFGHLFRTVDDTETDEELLFFITPRIVEGSFDDAAMRAAM